MQNARDHFKKDMAFPEGNKLFVSDFCANLDETNAETGLSNIKDTFAENL